MTITDPPFRYGHARVASSSYSYLPEGEVRATREQVANAVRDVPTAGDYIVDGSVLEELAAIYSRVTGRERDRVTDKQRRFLAACLRTHGDDLERLLAYHFAQTGETNLLMKVRTHREAIVSSVAEPAPTTSQTHHDYDFDTLPIGIIDPSDRTHRRDSVPCRAYADHQLQHRYLGNEVWICDGCPDLAERIASGGTGPRVQDPGSDRHASHGPRLRTPRPRHWEVMRDG